MTMSRSEMIAHIREHRKKNNIEDDPNLIDATTEEKTRPDNVAEDSLIEPEPIKRKPKENNNKKTADHTAYDYNDDKSEDYSEEDSYFDILQSKKLIRGKANEFKKLINKYCREIKKYKKNNELTETNISELIENHNYNKDLIKYEIEDIIDYTKQELPEDFTDKIDDIFETATDKFSDIIY
jgi:hypothetical protein